MTFQQPCFIRKNNPDLRQKLKELGYEICICATWKKSVWLDTSLLDKEAFVHGIGYSDPWETISVEEECQRFLENNKISHQPKIDCGTNENLFLAIAALRDYTDRYQWFVDDTAGVWERTEGDTPSKHMQMHGHKATLEEIIEHFNREAGMISKEFAGLGDVVKQTAEAVKKLVAPAEAISSHILSEESLMKREQRIIFQSSAPDKTELVLGNEFEIKIEDGKTFVIRKSVAYPKTYEECCKI